MYLTFQHPHLPKILTDVHMRIDYVDLLVLVRVQINQNTQSLTETRHVNSTSIPFTNWYVLLDSIVLASCQSDIDPMPTHIIRVGARVYTHM